MPFDFSGSQMAKRQAHAGSDGEPSPAATARPLSPERMDRERDTSRPSSPLRGGGNNAARRPRSPLHSSNRPPNVPQKDEPDGRTLSKEDLTKRVLRHLERAQDEEKRSRKGVEQIRTEVRSLRNSLRRAAAGKEKSRRSDDSPMREKQNNVSKIERRRNPPSSFTDDPPFISRVESLLLETSQRMDTKLFVEVL